MKSCLLFALIFGLVADGAHAADSLYATPEAAKYAEAARQVLIRALSESGANQKPRLRGIDTIYVGYPLLTDSFADPPSEFFHDLPFDSIVFAPFSQLPSRDVDFYAMISLTRAASQDTAEFIIDWVYWERRHGILIVQVSPATVIGSAKVVRRGDQWEIVRWNHRP